MNLLDDDCYNNSLKKLEHFQSRMNIITKHIVRYSNSLLNHNTLTQSSTHYVIQHNLHSKVSTEVKIEDTLNKNQFQFRYCGSQTVYDSFSCSDDLCYENDANLKQLYYNKELINSQSQLTSFSSEPSDFLQL